MHVWCRASTYFALGAVHLCVHQLVEVLKANGLVRSTSPFSERMPLKGRHVAGPEVDGGAQLCRGHGRRQVAWWHISRLLGPTRPSRRSTPAASRGASARAKELTAAERRAIGGAAGAAYPLILYTFREGKLLRLRAACDALWREERLSS